MDKKGNIEENEYRVLTDANGKVTKLVIVSSELASLRPNLNLDAFKAPPAETTQPEINLENGGHGEIIPSENGFTYGDKISFERFKEIQHEIQQGEDGISLSAPMQDTASSQAMQEATHSQDNLDFSSSIIGPAMEPCC